MLPSRPVLELLQDCEDPPLKLETLEALEIELGVRFPPDYAEFLLQFNGGHFTRPVIFYLPQPTKLIRAPIVNCFLGHAVDPQECAGLLWCQQVVADRFPENYLAIANCNSEDYVLLKFALPDLKFDGVWFWDGPGFFLPEYGPNIHRVADSFIEFLSMLLVDIEEEEEHEKLPIFQAVEWGNLKAVKQFLDEGGDVESRNAKGLTLLAAAAFYSWPKLVALLLERAADPTSRDKRGRTPLHHAATHSIDSLKLLLAAGADATARDRKGNSVLGNWSYRADQILRAHGARD